MPCFSCHFWSVHKCVLSWFVTSVMQSYTNLRQMWKPVMLHYSRTVWKLAVNNCGSIIPIMCQCDTSFVIWCETSCLGRGQVQFIFTCTLLQTMHFKEEMEPVQRAGSENPHCPQPHWQWEILGAWLQCCTSGVMKRIWFSYNGNCLNATFRFFWGEIIASISMFPSLTNEWNMKLCNLCLY